jgi:hypothetical protein
MPGKTILLKKKPPRGVAFLLSDFLKLWLPLTPWAPTLPVFGRSS